MSSLQVQAAGADLQVCVSPCPPPDRLAREWRTLEAQARPSFFTSWTWIGTWLHQLRHLPGGPWPALVRVHRGPDLVGLGLMVEQATRRLRHWPSRALHLHATGQSAWDDITIEHNGWLAREDLSAQVGDVVATQLWSRMPGVDQLHLPAVSTGREAWHALNERVREARRTRRGRLWPASPALHEIREAHVEPAYRVDLAQTRASGQAYLERLGPATRAAIRRSLRLYEALGPVRVESAGTVQEGLHFLSRLKHFHQAAWEGRGRPGAFANPRFEGFHTRLVSTGLPAGQVRLLRVMAGPCEVGYLYNFEHAGQVLAYQSGFHFGLVPRNHHPGLVVHALAVQQALENGCEGYDFLAGQARYKEQLASHRYLMSSFTLHRNCLGWRLERAWRARKAWFPWQASARFSGLEQS